MWKHTGPTGGQSIPAFDHYMAVGVAKTFVKEIIRILNTMYDDLNTEEVKTELKKYRQEHRLIINTAGIAYVKDILTKKLTKRLKSKTIERIIRLALKATDEATYQAMEAVVHNLNSMHSRAGGMRDVTVERPNIVETFGMAN